MKNQKKEQFNKKKLKILKIEMINMIYIVIIACLEIKDNKL